jgi:hypothetical protein
MQSTPSARFAFRRPSGLIAGLTAAWAIFGFILAIDSELELPPGTFRDTISRNSKEWGCYMDKSTRNSRS